MAVCSCSLTVTAGTVAATQNPGDNRGAMVLALFPQPLVLPLGAPRPLLDPKPHAEEPFCTGSAPLGLVSFST